MAMPMMPDDDHVIIVDGLFIFEVLQNILFTIY